MEALLWKTKLRVQRGVGQQIMAWVKKRDAVASMDGVGVELFTKQGVRIRNRVAKCTRVMSRKFLGAGKRLP
jgi:hypothetical protein